MAYSSDSKDSCPPREASASEVFPNGMGRIAGLYHVTNENLVESDTIDLKINVSGDESLLLYRVAQIHDCYFEFDQYFLGGELLPINLWISTAIPISDELFRETGLIEDMLERERMELSPVVTGDEYPNAMLISNPVASGRAALDGVRARINR